MKSVCEVASSSSKVAVPSSKLTHESHLKDEEKKIKRVIKSKEQDKQAVENEIVRAKTNSDEEWKKEKDRRTKEIAVVEGNFPQL